MKRYVRSKEDCDEDVEPEEEPDDDAPVDIEFDEYSDYEEE